jgi:hypothetical protein
MWLGLGLLHEEDKDYTTARDAYRAALEVHTHLLTHTHLHTHPSIYKRIYPSFTGRHWRYTYHLFF